jgi:imidazolonepropionase-like amidohydrolase
MIVKDPAALHVNFGERPTAEWRARDKIDTRMGLVAEMRQAFIDAAEYLKKWNKYEKELKEYNDNLQLPRRQRKKELDEPDRPKRDLGCEALVPALQGKLPVIASANRKDDILASIRVSEEFGLKLIVLHGAEAYMVAGILKTKNIPVLLGPVTTQPSSMEKLGAIYENAALLDRAGVLFAIIAGSTHNVRDIRFQAGIAVQYGLPISSALKAITINPARILGVDHDLGSIEPGKIANIAIFDGDPLQPLTRVTDVIIEGRRIPMESFQTELYEKYR